VSAVGPFLSAAASSGKEFFTARDTTFAPSRAPIRPSTRCREQAATQEDMPMCATSVYSSTPLPSSVAAPARASPLRLLARWIARSRERRALGELGDRLLLDIGLTREQATLEAEKSFWME
jgi:uncharacterized protein YjiS (DUF1127 family)